MNQRLRGLELAIVENQNIPTEHVEDQVDPELDFKDQYRRVLCESLPIDTAPAGTELVTYSKKDSRAASRSSSRPGPSAGQIDQRDKFNECLECWRGFVESADLAGECGSGESKGYRPDIPWYPNSGGDTFHDWMRRCLNWKREHPDEKHPGCDDLRVVPQKFSFCAGETVVFTVDNGNNPSLNSASCGTIVGTLSWQATGAGGGCGEEAKLIFTDMDGRKGCAFGKEKGIEDCCCFENATLSLLYDSLVMSCGSTQMVGVDPDNPGCPPYEWELSGEGEISSLEGTGVTYQAPLTNPNCQGNATIRVMDGCGKGAEVTFAVNCSSPDVDAYKVFNAIHYYDYCAYTCNMSDQGCMYREQWSYYRCDGSLRWVETYGQWYQHCPVILLPCGDPCGLFPGQFKNTDDLPPCQNHYVPWGCGDAVDLRTAGMIAAGCCPLNPQTGLPF